MSRGLKFPAFSSGVRASSAFDPAGVEVDNEEDEEVIEVDLRVRVEVTALAP